MERLQKTSPSLSLTEEQKTELAEIDSKYRAKIAEKELFLKGQIGKAQTEGKVDEINSLENSWRTLPTLCPARPAAENCRLSRVEDVDAGTATRGAGTRPAGRELVM